jgi:hypothetical protein
MPRVRTPVFDRSQRPPGAGPRGCDHPGCVEQGEFRAPRSRSDLREYYWFCLDHVRAYNATWDYFRGMGTDQIEAERRADIVGHRPSWPLGERGPKFHRLGHDDIREALRQFFENDGGPPPRKRPPTPEEEALAVLGLAAAANMVEIKKRYKALAKLHHPDANGGDTAAEERLKSINQAYTFLKTLRKAAVPAD